MSEQAIAQTQKANTPQATQMQGSTLQRQCSCGQHTIAGGECDECRQKRLMVQRWNKNRVEPYVMFRSLGQSINFASSTFIESHFDHDFSQIPVHSNTKETTHKPKTGDGQLTKPSLHTHPSIQRFPKNGIETLAPSKINPASEISPEVELITGAGEPAMESALTTEGASPDTELTPSPAEPTPEPETPVETPSPGLLVEDSAEEVAPGQMRKTEFLTELRTAVCSTAEAVLTGTGRTTEGCPYLDYWFDYYSERDSQHIERAIHRYAPEAAGVITARGYIPIITVRVRRSVEAWAKTGEITGVPEGVPTTLPGTIPAEGEEGARTPTGPVMFKAREGGAKLADDPQAIQEQLGDGRPLDSSIRSRMESAFGRSFSHVRVHTDNMAAGLSNSLNARAFTVGEHIAFGSGEYQPETLIGDTLIAHELAHVAQQSGGSVSLAPSDQGSSGYNSLEEDADLSTVGAMASLWGKVKGRPKDIAQNAMPRLRSGLGLQRCSREPSWSAVGLQPRNSLWFFCGENPSEFSTSARLRTANFSNATNVNWSITHGADKVEFDGTPTGAEVRVKSKAGSTSRNDVRIEARQGTGSGAQAFTGSLTVRKPHSLEMVGSPNDQASCPPWDASCPGHPVWWTQITYRLKDNMNDTLQSVDVNENFPSAKSNDIPNNWVDPSSFSTVPFWSSSKTSGGTFVDNWYVWGGMPSPVAPSDPGANTSVDRIPHEFYVGSQTSAHGCRVQTHTAHRYLGYARHEGITTPAP